MGGDDGLVRLHHTTTTSPPAKNTAQHREGQSGRPLWSPGMLADSNFIRTTIALGENVSVRYSSPTQQELQRRRSSRRRRRKLTSEHSTGDAAQRRRTPSRTRSQVRDVLRRTLHARSSDKLDLPQEPARKPDVRRLGPGDRLAGLETLSRLPTREMLGHLQSLVEALPRRCGGLENTTFPVRSSTWSARRARPVACRAQEDR